MSTVYSVSEITNILSTIIKDQSALQKVWVHGKISWKPSSIPKRLPYSFMIEGPANKIKCLIYQEYASLFRDLPPVGNDVFINGSIILRPSKGRYRFVITDIEMPGINQKDQIVSVSFLTNTLRTSIEAHSNKIQGKISKNPSKTPAGYIRLDIKNANANERYSTEMIQCLLPPNIANNLSFSPQRGDKVSIDGQFSIFPSVSRYQIIARDIQRVLRANLHEDEAQVVTTVEDYFKELQGFSIAKECEIQMGVDQRRPDIVLIDSEGVFAAIAECKRNNVIGYGLKQLKSYLCATDTRFGIFANSTDRDTWIFYENLRHNRFQEVDRSEFEKRVVESPITRHQLQDKIKVLESKCEQLKSEICCFKRKESEWKEKIQQFETLFNDLRGGLLDLKPTPQTEGNIDLQKINDAKK